MKYYLAEACKNTFILFDYLNSPIEDANFFFKARQCLEKENRDDALILTNSIIEDGSFHARMMVLGLDGNFGEFCGNGSRACAAYLFEKYPHAQTFYLDTYLGSHPLQKHSGDSYSIKLPTANFKVNPKFVTDENFIEHYGLNYVEMIEPHLIIEKDLNDDQLFSLGRELNSQKNIFPLGINVNAWHILDNGTLHVKTYERGVQRLTQSCGTGSISCASYYKKYGTVSVVTPGGPLKITLNQNFVELQGPAKVG